MVVCGDRDPFVPVDHAWGLRASCPTARLFVAPGLRPRGDGPPAGPVQRGAGRLLPVDRGGGRRAEPQPARAPRRGGATAEADLPTALTPARPGSTGRTDEEAPMTTLLALYRRPEGGPTPSRRSSAATRRAPAARRRRRPACARPASSACPRRSAARPTSSWSRRWTSTTGPRSMPASPRTPMRAGRPEPARDRAGPRDVPRPRGRARPADVALTRASAGSAGAWILSAPRRTE